MSKNIGPAIVLLLAGLFCGFLGGSIYEARGQRQRERAKETLQQQLEHERLLRDIHRGVEALRAGD